jgi:trk system potassium uptake protein TrkA
VKAIILGAGTVGTEVARQLIGERKDVILVEKNADTAGLASNNLDCMVVNDEGSNIEVLRRIGAADADYFIAVTSSDEVNMISCGLARREFKRPVTIARVRNPYYTFAEADELSFLGIDHIVNPEVESAKAVLQAVEHGARGDAMVVADRRLLLQASRVDQDHAFVGRTLAEFRRGVKGEFLVPLILKEGELVIPSGSTVLEEGDEVYYLGEPSVLDSVHAAVGDPRVELKKIAIIGGGRVGSYLLDSLLVKRPRSRVLAGLSRVFRPAGVQVAVFERSIDKCKALSDRFPDATVNHCDVSEDEGFVEEQLPGFDLVVAVTGNQELNLVAAAHAKVLGVKRAAALVVKQEYVRVARQIGVDVTVSLKESVARSVLSVIRKGVIRTVHALGEAGLEIVELTIDKRSGLAGRRIDQAGLPRETLVLFVIRDGRTTLPDGATVLRTGDQVGIIASKASFSKLEERFLGRS